MPKFTVRQETVSEELIEVEAETDIEAIEIAAQGGGTLLDQVVTWPTILGVEETTDYSVEAAVLEQLEAIKINFDEDEADE